MKVFNRQALRVSLVFFAFSFLWIIFSDRLALKFIHNPYLLTQIQTYKGWFYVLVASIIIFFLVRAGVLETLKFKKRFKEEKSKHDILFEIANDAIFILDECNSFFDCNSKTLEIFECTKDQIIGMKPYQVSPKYQPNGIESSKLANEKIQLARNGDPQRFDWVHTNLKKTKEFYTETSVSMKKILGMEYLVAVIHDISEQKLAEIALKESEAKYRRLTENSPEITYIYSLERGALYWSSRVKEILGFDPENLKNDSIKWDEAIHPDDKPGIDEFFKNIKIGENYNLEYRIYDIKNKIHWFNDRIFNVYKSNNEIIVEGIISDVTDKQKMQQKVLHAMINAEERERNRIAKDLHDGVSPVMSAIKLYIQSLSDTTNHQLRIELIGKISNTIHEAISSINEISNNVSPHVLQNFGLKAAVESFVAKISGLKEIHIDLHFELEHRFDENTEIAFYRITTELINNTLKYAKADNITIKYYLKHGHVFMLYKDNGKGFDTEKVLNSRTGMGIFNMKNRINSLNGEFKIESIENEGVYVEIMVPLNC